MAKLDSPLRFECGLVETSPEARPPRVIYIARTPVQDRREVQVSVLNTTHREQVLARGSHLAHSEPVTLVTPPDFDHRQAPESSSKVQEIIEAARSNLSHGEFQELVDLITEYEDIFASGREEYGRIDSVSSHRHERRPTDSSAPEETTLSKEGRSERDAGRHATPWDYRGI
jgi:hypothetical protein